MDAYRLSQNSNFAKPRLKRCPKCGGTIFKDDGEENCVNCGFTIYQSPLPHVPINKIYG